MAAHRNSLNLISLVTAGLLVSNCAADGGRVSAGKPLDKERTRVAICSGVQKIDMAFSALADSSPALFPGNAVEAEGAFVRTVGFLPANPGQASPGSLCAPVYAGDLDVAINTAIQATVNISQLIQAWNKAKP